MKTQLIKDWMTKDPVVVDITTTVPEAHALLTRYRIRRLPVVHDGKLVGIVTLGDVRGAEPSEATSLSIFELNYLLSKLTIDRIMTTPVATIRPDETVFDAARLMLQKKIAGLVVVGEAGEVIGVVTESDIFRMIVRLWEQEAEEALTGL
jgi:CBS domain-containing protein